MKHTKNNQIFLNDLSKNSDWATILNETFENPDLSSDVILPESDTINLKPLALDIKNKMTGVLDNKNLKTGFNELDQDIDFLGSGLIILSGKEKSGKTALTLQIAIQVIENNPKIPVFYFAYGDSKRDLQQRIFLSLGKMTRTKYRKGQFDHQNAAEALKKYQSIGDRLFIVEGHQTFYPNKIKEAVVNTLSKYYGDTLPGENSCIVIVDYIQEVPSYTGNQSMDERIIQVSSALKDLSKIISSPVIVVYGNPDVERLTTQSDDLKITVEKKESLDFASDVYMSIIPTNNRIPKINSGIPKDIKPYRINIYKNKNGEEGDKYMYFSPSNSRWFMNI